LNIITIARLGRVKNLAPLVPNFDPPGLQPGDVVSTKNESLEFELTHCNQVIYCDLSRFTEMTQDQTQVVDNIKNVHIPIELYQKCADLLEPKLEAFTIRAILPDSNTQVRPDFINLCPWYLQDLKQTGDLHLSQNVVQQAMAYPGGDITDPDIDALTSLDTTMLHEVIPTTFKLYYS
jgi:hypothetical protein